jgi:hypothetical protein
MTACVYPRAAVLADYARSGAGIAAAGVPLVFADLALPVMALLIAIVLVFTLELVRVVRRQWTEIVVDENGLIATGATHRRLQWADLRRLRLAYYSTRRDGSNGWLRLTLADTHVRMSIDSRIGGFDGIVSRAVDAARMNRLAIDPATLSNLSGIGLPITVAPHRNDAR